MFLCEHLGPIGIVNICVFLDADVKNSDVISATSNIRRDVIGNLGMT